MELAASFTSALLRYQTANKYGEPLWENTGSKILTRVGICVLETPCYSSWWKAEPHRRCTQDIAEHPSQRWYFTETQFNWCVGFAAPFWMLNGYWGIWLEKSRRYSCVSSLWSRHVLRSAQWLGFEFQRTLHLCVSQFSSRKTEIMFAKWGCHRRSCLAASRPDRGDSCSWRLRLPSLLLPGPGHSSWLGHHEAAGSPR